MWPTQDTGWTHFAVGERYDASLFQVHEKLVETGWVKSP